MTDYMEWNYTFKKIGL